MFDVRTSGRMCLWAGVLGAASGIYLAVAPASVDDTVFSYPLTTAGFALIQVWFFVQHLGLLAGIRALPRLHEPAPGRAATIGHWLAGGGMVGLALTEVWAISFADATYPSSETAPVDAAYGITSTAIGVGLVLVGLAIARSGRVAGWARHVPLALGVYVFVPMFPAMMAGFLGARLAITGWMIGFAVLGYVLTLAQRADVRPVDRVNEVGAATSS